MASDRNYLLGQGQDYAEPVEIKQGGGEKKPVYTFDQAKKRLAPMMAAAVKQFASLPRDACPNDEAVAVATLHHEYLSKSAFPDKLIKATGLRAIGSRPTVKTPSKVSTQRAPSPQATAELYLAGPRSAFAELTSRLPSMRASNEIAEDLIKIEEFRAPSIAERVQPITSKEAKPRLEVVLHAGEGKDRERMLQSFKKYAGTLGVPVDLDERIDAGRLSFVSLRAPAGKVNDLARFSFLRRVREMPKLRQLRPRNGASSAQLKPFDLSMPAGQVMDPTIRVAVFDGGFPDVRRLARYVDRYDINVADVVAEYESHGLAVTSALLFGPFERGVAPRVPYAKVDHYRVLDVDTDKDPQYELYPVLRRIASILESEIYDFVVLSIGPDIPMQDDDVHPWTAKLDPLFSNGSTLAIVAAGNSGDADAQAQLNKIQPPADGVNSVSVGACNTRGPSWKRARYSSVGHGRCPGIMKPDGVAFGGDDGEPFWVVDHNDHDRSTPMYGTSLAGPYAMHSAIGVRAVLGPGVRPLTIRALMLHMCENPDGHAMEEVGWGRFETEVEKLVTSASSSTHVLYQGTLSPKKYLRAMIPLPPPPLVGPITISATLCFTCATDSEHPVHYTRSGLEITFRPDIKKIRKNGKTPESLPFFGAPGSAELIRRHDAHKWETVRRASMEIDGTKLSKLGEAAFDIHCFARDGGRDAMGEGKDIPYGMVVSISAPNMPDAYDKIVAEYPKLRPIMPRIQTRVRT